MCGIVGIMNFGGGAIVGTDMNIFMQLLHADAVRGMHGTGLFAVDRDGANQRIRAGGPPHILVGDKQFEKFEAWVGSSWVRAIVGHNRYATRGKINTENAHPFRDGETILLHNGTLDSFSHLPDAKKYDVDSEAICHAFEVDGPEKTIKSLEGAWALVWYDGKTKTVNFLRNKERPLWMARDKKAQRIAFASEPGMLEWVLVRNSIWEYDLEQLPTDMWYSYHINDGKPHVKELKGKEKKESKKNSYADGDWSGWGKDSREDMKGPLESKIQADKIIALPAPKKSGSSATSTHSATTDRGSLPSTVFKGNSKASSKQKAHWIASDAIHDIGKGQFIVVYPRDYKQIGDVKDGLYQVLADSDDYPDVLFRCMVKGQQSVLDVLEAKALRGEVRSILRSMADVAQNPHEIHLCNPEPIWDLDAALEQKIPEHAFVEEAAKS